MKAGPEKTAEDIRSRLADVGGKISHDLGLGRIVGQILVYLYLQEHACSLDGIGEDLGLSKAAVSIAARQLESLGLLRRVWIKGERKLYYRTADDIGSALQNGLLSFLDRKVKATVGELDTAVDALTKASDGPADPEVAFLTARLKRAKVLGDRAVKVMDSPVLKFFARA